MAKDNMGAKIGEKGTTYDAIVCESGGRCNTIVACRQLGLRPYGKKCGPMTKTVLYCCRYSHKTPLANLKEQKGRPHAPH
jgi:hypothetical protein